MLHCCRYYNIIRYNKEMYFIIKNSLILSSQIDKYGCYESDNKSYLGTKYNNVCMSKDDNTYYYRHMNKRFSCCSSIRLINLLIKEILE
jgi:hypothetical protein